MADLNIAYSSSLPQPNLDDPLAQLRYVYEERAELANSDATKETYRTAFRNHVRYILDRDGFPNERAIKPIFVEDEFSVDFFFQMYQWHLRRGIYNLSTGMSSLREVIRHCRSNGYISTDVIITKVKTKHRDAHHGDTHTAYSEDLYHFVRQALINDYQFLRTIAKPYAATGVGQNPKIRWNPCWTARLEVLSILHRRLLMGSGVVTEQDIGTELQQILDKRAKQYWRRVAKDAIAYLSSQGYIESQPFCGAVIVFKKKATKLQLKKSVGARSFNQAKAFKRRFDLQKRIQAFVTNGVGILNLHQVYPKRLRRHHVLERFLSDLEALTKMGAIDVMRKVFPLEGGYSITILKKDPDSVFREQADGARYGWANKNNWRWYFEHVMNGRIPPHRSSPSYKLFSQNVSHYFLRNRDERERLMDSYDVSDKEKITKALLASWGIVPRLRSSLVISLMAYLAKLTGLNVESLKDLKLGCLKFEPLTRTYYLEYFKARSGGSKELPLTDELADEFIVEDKDVLDHGEYQGFESDGKHAVYRKPIAFLPDAKRIREIIELAESLTSRFRSRAPKELREKLFLFETSRWDSHKRPCVSDINRYHFIDWVRHYFKPHVAGLMKRSLRTKHGGLDDSALRNEERKIGRQIASTSLAVSRLRSTLATNLVKQGAPIELVQAVLGHSSLLTTERYLDKLQLETTLYSEVGAALNRLKKEKSKHVKVLGSVEQLRQTIAKSPKDKPSDGYIFQTPGCLHCRDPQNPSTKIKQQHRNWIDGESTCSKWNMCLFCDNVVIVDVTLPRLIAYQTKLKLDLRSGLISVRVNNQLVRKAVRLIDEIIDSKNGFFSKEVIDDARARAEAWIDRDPAEFFFEEGRQSPA
ncbi:MAG: site-specific integrase [Gammaproteobacteria bacterium]|nr:site-specific integrase [Gammaproteobacteria bacterium]